MSWINPGAGVMKNSHKFLNSPAPLALPFASAMKQPILAQAAAIWARRRVE
jgi:hypothetical protein